jgi:hypothetical protein
MEVIKIAMTWYVVKVKNKKNICGDLARSKAKELTSQKSLLNTAHMCFNIWYCIHCNKDNPARYAPDRIDSAEVGEVVLVGGVVAVPRNNIKRRVILEMDAYYFHVYIKYNLWGAVLLIVLYSSLAVH